jgi:hypothetical protein
MATTVCDGCGSTVEARKRHSYADSSAWVAGFPYWRGRCRRCSVYLCKRGHRTGTAYGSVWVGGGFACVKGECGLFYETWWRAFRAARPMAVGRRLPSLTGDQRRQLRAWAREHPGPRGEAVREFADRF